MTGTYNKMNLYKAETNPYLKHTKNLVPRIVAYNGTFGFCLIEKHRPKAYYCFLTKYGVFDRDIYCSSDVIVKLSLADYFKISDRLRSLRLKINLKKIIYDSNRNK